jgi:hypothetical protein
MKRILLYGILFLSYAGYAQTPELSCTQVLRTARTVYEQGRLHELPALVEGCLTGKKGSGKFSESEMVEANKILVNTYIYLEEPAKADAAMISLLQTDYFFKPNTAVDPVEFQSLYKKFRTWPIFSFGFKFGVNTSGVNVLKNYYIWSPSQGNGEYKSSVGIQLGLFLEKEFKKKFILNPEVFYTSNSFKYTNSALSTQDDPAKASSDKEELTHSQSRMQLNVLVQYKLGERRLNPYVMLGPSISYLMSSTLAGDVSVGQITLPSTDTREHYKTINYSVIAGAGLKYKIGGIYVTADIRYQYGLGNIVNGDNRYSNSEKNVELMNAGYVVNDYSLNHTMINIGLIVPRFVPKKLIK